MDTKRLTLLAVALGIVLLGVSVSSAANTVTVNIPAGASTPSGAPGYSPDTITVVIGINNTVTFVNQDTSPHTVTADDNSFNSGNLNPNQTWTNTFDTPGTFKFHCIYHSWMTGTIVVKGSAVPEFPNSELALILSLTVLAAVLGIYRYSRGATHSKTVAV